MEEGFVFTIESGLFGRGEEFNIDATSG